MSKQVIHSVDDEDYAWLRQLADADGCGVGEIVRRCVRFARQSQDEPEPQAEQTQAELQAEWDRAEAFRLEQERRVAIAQKRAELEALERGDSLPPQGQPANLAPSVLDHDFSNEPRAEEVEVPLDPDDAPPRAVPQQRAQTTTVHRANPTLFDTTAMTPPSGMRPGTATRPAAPNREQGMGLKMGDAQGNVVRANFAHLGFSRGGV